MRFVIVGLHAAGRSAAETLRALCPDAEIVGVDPDADGVYARPLISYVLAGECGQEALAVKGADYWKNLGVRVVPERAVALDPDAKTLTLASGSRLSWDKLLLACGARARSPGVEGEAADEVRCFRTRADLGRVLEKTAKGGRAVVLGGGLVGFKLCMGLIARGMDVRLLVTSPRPLSLNVDEEVGDWAVDRFEAHPGITLHTETTVARVDRAPSGGLKLVTESGEEFQADLVAAGKGVVPDIEWLTAAGLDARYGLMVDGRLMTSAPDVYAAGDCVQAMDLALDEPRINAVWPLAVEQGRVAAMNMAGYCCPYPGSLAMNAIPVFGSQMVSVGAVNPTLTQGCDFVVNKTPGGSYLKLVFRRERLIGAVGLNAAPRLGELGWAVRRGLGKRDIPDTWWDRQWNAAPLSAATTALAGNARL